MDPSDPQAGDQSEARGRIQEQVGAQPWRAGIDPDRRKRVRRIKNQREALRQFTVGTAVTAVALNTLLFLQTDLYQFNAGDLQTEIVAAVRELFPGAGMRPPANSPSSPSPGSRPVAVTGGS